MTTHDEDISALHSVVPKLERLGEAMVTKRVEQIRRLREFQLAESLKRLNELAEKRRTEFDALDFIGQSSMGSGGSLWGSEEFHSNVLAWLLDPNETHGVGDRFLKPFLGHAGVGAAGLSADWSATKVVREWVNQVDGYWGYLDILIVNEAERTLCAIENKVFSSEHSNQLTRYRKAAEDVYPNFTRHHVFLTPWRSQPYCKKERVHWASVSYAAVFEIVEGIVEGNDNSTDEDVLAFLRQYATTLRRNIVPDTSVSLLARKIYLENREAMEQVIANKPDYVTEAKEWLKEAVARQPGWRLDREDAGWLRFRSTDWDRYEAMKTGTGWLPGSNALLLFQFVFRGVPPYLDLGLSTGDEGNNRLRSKLFEAVQQHPEHFRPTSTHLTDGWMILHAEKERILDWTDYGPGWDGGATRAKLEAWVADFAENRFPAMNDVIVKCFSEYEAELRQEDDNA